MRLAIFLYVAAVVGGCGASAELRARYSTEVARCIANERAIVDRPGTSFDEDQRDLLVERSRCDAALAAIGGVP